VNRATTNDRDRTTSKQEFRPKSLNELKEVLADPGLQFGTRGDDDDNAVHVRNSNNPWLPNGVLRLPLEDDGVTRRLRLIATPST
jgi:hypothetical protein